jgi:hypothetical protein
MSKIEAQNVAMNKLGQGFLASQVSSHELDKRLNDFLDRLLEAIPLPEPKVISDEEVVAALTAYAPPEFSNSEPCWTEENNALDLIDRRSGVERRRGAVSKAVGAGS